MRVGLLACSVPDFHTYVKFIKTTTGQSPTREVDRAGHPVGDALSYLLSLESIIKSKGISKSLELFSITFGIHCPVEDYILIIDILERANDLRIYTNKKETEILSITTANLKTWKHFIVDASQKNELREIANYCYLALDKMGLSSIFKDCRRSSVEGGMFEICYSN